jgi:PPM family protein phosphatase
MKATSFGGTDAGKRRANNEDSFLLDDGLSLYAVADGIGGSEGGEIASRIAVETLSSTLPDLLKGSTGAAGVPPEDAALLSAVALAHQNILREQELRPKLAEMGTTLTTLLLAKGQAVLAHVGDSRAYRLRSGTLRQLTNDHALVAEQLRAGVLTPEQARTSPYRHVITRALGAGAEVRPDILRYGIEKGDRFLLCTDGLTEMVDDREIARILESSAPQEAVQELIAAANRNGGVDNITAVAVWVTEV